MRGARWAVVFGAVCLVVAVAAVAYAAGKAKAVPVQEVVRAKRFELVDEKGRVRGVVTVDDDTAQLELRSSSGANHISLLAGNPDTALVLQGGKKSSVMLAIDALGGSSTLSLRENHGGGVDMNVGRGSPAVFMWGDGARVLLSKPGGLGLASLAVDEGGDAYVVVHGERGGGAYLTSRSKGDASVVVSGGDGQGRAGLWVTGKGASALRLEDGLGGPRAVIGDAALETMGAGAVTRRASELSIALFDKEGKVLWQAP